MWCPRAITRTFNRHAVLLLKKDAGRLLGDGSEPESQAGDERRIVCQLAGRARQAGGLAEFAQPVHADIRGHLAGDFVAQAQAAFDISQAGTDFPRTVVLAIKIGLDRRRQDQALREAAPVPWVTPAPRVADVSIFASMAATGLWSAMVANSNRRYGFTGVAMPMRSLGGCHSGNRQGYGKQPA